MPCTKKKSIERVIPTNPAAESIRERTVSPVIAVPEHISSITMKSMGRPIKYDDMLAIRHARLSTTQTCDITRSMSVRTYPLSAGFRRVVNVMLQPAAGSANHSHRNDALPVCLIIAHMASDMMNRHNGQTQFGVQQWIELFEHRLSVLGCAVSEQMPRYDHREQKYRCEYEALVDAMHEEEEYRESYSD